MTRARINLRLVETARAENVLRINKYDDNGNFISSPPVAYATAAILTNVVPVVEEAKRARIASGEISKTPCAWIEGDLVAWQGRYQKGALADLREILKETRTPDLMMAWESLNTVFGDTAAVGFNPKKLKSFYVDTGDGRQVFTGADRALICHWHYAVQNPALRPVEKRDLVTGAIAPSSVERFDLPKGVQTTLKALDQLGLNLR